VEITGRKTIAGSGQAEIPGLFSFSFLKLKWHQRKIRGGKTLPVTLVTDFRFHLADKIKVFYETVIIG
jgi:hypothetical protein